MLICYYSNNIKRVRNIQVPLLSIRFLIGIVHKRNVLNILLFQLLEVISMVTYYYYCIIEWILTLYIIIRKYRCYERL